MCPPPLSTPGQMSVRQTMHTTPYTRFFAVNSHATVASTGDGFLSMRPTLINDDEVSIISMGDAYFTQEACRVLGRPAAVLCGGLQVGFLRKTTSIKGLLKHG